MADLLRSGHTMLNIACSVCNNPIFRNKEGLMFCPTCNREVQIVDEKTTQNFKQEEFYIQTNQSDKNKPSIKNVDNMKKVIINKMQWITEKLNLETELSLVEKYTRTLLNLIDILNKVSKL
ncbi:MAG: Sjogren's syndrome/scleroderma autoantigen 1 family protein [Candidatus Thorarchaeota archaeon]